MCGPRGLVSECPPGARVSWSVGWGLVRLCGLGFRFDCECSFQSTFRVWVRDSYESEATGCDSFSVPSRCGFVCRAHGMGGLCVVLRECGLGFDSGLVARVHVPCVCGSGFWYDCVGSGSSRLGVLILGPRSPDLGIGADCGRRMACYVV